MKKNGLILWLLIVFLTACAAPVTEPTPTVGASPRSVTASPAIPPLMATIVPSITPSATPFPTQTPAPPTMTPLPTIPTFTPTFDAQQIVTATPAPKAVCPPENSAIEINIPETRKDLDAAMQLVSKLGNLILTLLNKGLQVSSLLDELKGRDYPYLYQDFNNDGVKDILLSDFGRIHLFYCERGQYNIFTEDRFSDTIRFPVLTVMDLNKNGLPEILLVNPVGGLRGGAGYLMEEWNGKNFIDVGLDPETQSDPGIGGSPPKIEFKDTNHDGLQDLVFTGEGPWDEDLLSRVKTIVYRWNGRFYAEAYVSYAEQQYRFQAIQDADRELLYGNDEKAFALYQEAIFNDKLEWWSRERQKYMVDTHASQYDPTPTVYSTPVPDKTEYPKLAAYAYYRMIILRIHLGEMDAAQTQYATLQAKFPAGSPGHSYAEMAADFWNAYQSAGTMYNACAAAIAFADAHPEILTPLGSDYHGWQSHTYTPPDVCPFR